MKKCEIYNDQFSWVMEVDSHKILFKGRDNAEYFRDLYIGLGYEVYFDSEYYRKQK